MKIIGVDNFNRDSVADFLVCENVRNDMVGKIMVDALNADALNGNYYFFKLVPDDYRLSRGMEDLI